MGYYYDGPEVIDEIYSQFYSKGGGGVFAVDECEKPPINKISRYVKVSSCLSSEIRKSLKVAKCPKCGFKPIPNDTLIYINPHNNQASWCCNMCSHNGVYKWKKWHRLPAFKRNKKTISTEKKMYNTIAKNNGQNIKSLSCILGWSYGKTRGACKRLEEKGLIKIEKLHENNYYESKIYIIS